MHANPISLSDYEFIARNDGFWRAPEIDLCYETKGQKGDGRYQTSIQVQVYIESLLKSG